MIQKSLRFVGYAALLMAYLVATLWATGALWFDLPLASAMRNFAALLWIIAVVAVPIFVRPFRRGLLIIAIEVALILAWWLTITPPGNRDWQRDVAQKAWADIQGDEVTVHSVRNFEYRSETDYTPRWETRTVKLSNLTGADLAINYWGSPWIAHPIASFRFSDSLPLAFSIETRKVVGQSYSTLAGFYRQYELIYIPADERDVIRLRTNYRNEEVYLYHIRMSPEHARRIFLEYLKHLNELHAKAEFYNAITDNCTTNIRAANIAAERGKVHPWNWRVLLNGKMDELLYARGFIDTSLPFAELKRRARINDRAQAANDAPDFSEKIRSHLVD